MKVLFLADVEEPWVERPGLEERLRGVRLIVSCGDLPASYLSYLASVQGRPVAYVPGNHDLGYRERPPEGCIPIDGRVCDFHGLRLAGLGGSRWYSERALGYTEDEMARRATRLALLARVSAGLDLIVTHAPVAGYGDLDDLPHAGFACFDQLLERTRPFALVHGHVHMSYGRVARELEHPSGAVLVNAYGSYLLDIPIGEHKGIIRPEPL